ncbi:hypothetical protein P7C70_g1419, partial [Phenoliferia sp. Uapishka_3]
MGEPQRLPRIYLVRHGETAWSLSGQHTGKSDIPLTANGEAMISSLAPKIVGPGLLLDPIHIQHAFISPRQRARKTFDLLFANSTPPPSSTEDLCQEWDYGKYEGRTAKDIRDTFDKNWQIWEDGCPEGESAQEMSDRCDKMIEKILEKGKSHVNAKGEKEGCGDMLIVSHGRGYQHRNFDERSLLGLNLFGPI